MIHNTDPNNDTAQPQANNQSQQIVDQRQMEGTERENSAQNSDFAVSKPEKPSSALAQPQQTLQTEPKEKPLQILFKQTLSSVKALTNQCQFQGGMAPGADLTLSANARPTLIPIFTRNTKLSFGPPTNFIIDPPSEGEESEDEIIQPPDIVQRYDEKGGPSLIDVVDRIVDPSFLVPTTKFDEIPKGIKPMLLIQNIRSDYRAQQLKDRLEYYFDKINMRRIQPESIHMIKLNQINQQIKSALIHYEKTSDVQQVFEALQKKENYQATGSFANMKESYCWNKKQLEQEKWVGVVLRNFPPSCPDETLVKNLSKDASYKILSCEKTQEIKGQRCGILRMPDIEQAEKLCKKWNNYSFTQSKRLKAHIHPFSYPKRPKPETSHHMLFQKYKKHFRSSGEESSQVYEPQKPKLEDMLGQLSNLYQKAPQNMSPPKSQHQEVLPPQIHSQPESDRPVKLEDTTIKSKSAAIQPKEVNLQQISEEHSLTEKRGTEQIAPRNSAAAPEPMVQKRKEQLDQEKEEDPVGALLSIREKKIAPKQPSGLAALVPPSQQKAVKQEQPVSQSSSKQHELASLEEILHSRRAPQKKVQKKTQIENRVNLRTTTASSMSKGDNKAANNDAIERRDQATKKVTSDVNSKEALQEEDKRKDNSSKSKESDSKIIGKRKLRKLSDEDMMVRSAGRSSKRQRIVESSPSPQADEDDSKSSVESSQEEYTWEDMDREESMKEQPKKRSTRPPRRQSSGGGSSQKTSEKRSKVVQEEGLTEQPKRRGRPSKKRSSTYSNKDQVFKFPSGTNGTNGNDKAYLVNTLCQGVSPSKQPTQLQQPISINQVTSEAEARKHSQEGSKDKSQQESGSVSSSKTININVQTNHIKNGQEKGEQSWNPQ